MIHNNTQALGNDFGNTFISYVAQAYGPEVLQGASLVHFWNESNQSVIDITHKVWVVESLLNHIAQRGPNNAPLTFIE